MKTVQVPTSFKEIKALYKTWTSNRYRNNCQVLISLRNDIKRMVKNVLYWKDDISETMIIREINKVFNEAIKQLK